MIKKNLSSILEGSILVGILILSFYFKLYRIENPVADWHSWRQADTAAVARNFFNDRFNPLLPKYDDMSDVSGLGDNLKRYRFVEFPIYNSLVYFAYLINGGVDERLARVVSILMSLGSIILIYLVVKDFWGKAAAFLSALIYAFLPYNIYYSRTILPEPTLIFLSLGAFYFTHKWIWLNDTKNFFLSVIFTALAMLVKPTAVFYLLPLIYSVYLKEGIKITKPRSYFKYIYFLILSFAPLIAWRVWANQYPQGIPPSGWLLNGNGIRFRPAFWRWIIGDRFDREILSVAGSILLFLGLICKPPTVKEKWLLHLLFLSSFLYLLVVATGNVQHDYYQYLIIPAFSIFTARGIMILASGINELIPRLWTIPLAISLLILCFYLTWYEDKGLFQINNGSIVEAGEVAQKLLPRDALVIASYQGDTSFLYLTGHAGWAYVAYPIDEMVKRFKIHYYISVNFDNKTNWVIRNFQVVTETPHYVIVDLWQRTKYSDPVNDPEPS